MKLNQTFQAWLCAEAARVALRKNAPNRIPMTGPITRTRDYYSVNLGDNTGQRLFLATAQTSQGVQGLWFVPYQHEPVEASIANWQLPNFRMSIRHYFGEIEIEEDRPWRFLIQQFLRWPKFLLARERLSKFLFNRKSLVRTDRISVLRYVLGQTLEEDGRSVGISSLMTHLYSYRWAEHPDLHREYRYNALLLESLAASQDLSENNGTYRATAKALTTLAAHEDSDRRHTDMFKQQAALKVLTAALVIIGAIQVWVTWKGTPIPPTSTATAPSP